MSSNELTLVPSYAALKATKPTEQGQRVLLTGWNEGTNIGGGYFIGYLVNRNVTQKYSDGGIIAHGKDYYWERIVSDPSKLTVVEFGAIPDGKTDIADAALAMHKWSLANYPGIGIQLPAGRVFLSKLHLLTESSTFRLSGPTVNFGYFANTYVVTDTGPVDDKGVPIEEFLIDVKHRWVEISNIVFEGVSTVDKPNKKGVFRNNVTGGQYFNGKCLKFNKIGGTCLSLMDTLDSKIDQWYTSQTTGDIIINTWSGRIKGSWNHSTALELSNFNVQYSRLGKVFDMDRCTQALIRNGWIEHSDNPGSLCGGHWTIENLSMEDCKTKLRVSCAQLTEINKNSHGDNSGIDYTRDNSDQWLSEWERGRVDINPYGIYVERSLEPGTIMSRNKISNVGSKPGWYQVGTFFVSEEGDSVDINMVACGDMLSKSAKLADIDGVRQGGGNTLIRMQTWQQGGVGGTFQPVGSSPVMAAKFVKISGGRFTLLVQVKPYTRNVIPLITATSKTRYEAGVSYYFEPDIKAVSDEDLSKLENLIDIKEQWSIGCIAGVGATNEGNLILKSKVENDHLVVQVNVGTSEKPKIELRYIELKKASK